MRNQRKAGVLLTYISEIIKILSTLLYTPIMLRLLGKSEYGLYQLVYTTVAYLSILKLGFTASYIRYYSKFKAANNEKEIYRLNGMFITIFLVMAAITVICGVFMIFNIKSVFGTGLTESEYDIARVLMAFMIFNLALTFPNSVFTSITSAHERFIFQRSLLVLNNLLTPFLTLPLLLLGYGSIGMVMVTTAITIGLAIANVWYVFFKLHEKFIFKDFQFSLLKELWVFTFFIFLNQIIDQINWSLGRFLLGRLIGTAAVAVFSLGGLINNLYIMLSTSVSSVFVPRVNKIVAVNNDNHELSLLFARIGRIQFIILCLILTGFIFFGKPFIKFWGGAGYEDSYFVTLWLIAPVTVPLIQNIGIEIQRAKNKHQIRALVYFLIAICNIFMSIPLIKLYGVIGAAIGTAISLMIGNILFMNWYYAYKIGIDIKGFWRSIISFFPSLLIPITVGYIVTRYISINSIGTFVLCAFVYTLVYIVSLWLFGMNSYEKNIVLGAFKSVKQRLGY